MSHHYSSPITYVFSAIGAACGFGPLLIAAAAPVAAPAIVAPSGSLILGLASLIAALTPTLLKVVDGILKDRTEGRVQQLRLAEIARDDRIEHIARQVDRTDAKATETESYAHTRLHEVIRHVNANTVIREDHEARLGTLEHAMDRMLQILAIDRDWMDRASALMIAAGIDHPLPDGFRRREFDPPSPPAPNPAHD